MSSSNNLGGSLPSVNAGFAQVVEGTGLVGALLNPWVETGATDTHGDRLPPLFLTPDSYVSEDVTINP